MKITVQSPLPSGDRIYKPDIRKAAEVRVGGDHRQAMLQGERRQVGVGHMLRAKPCRTRHVPRISPWRGVGLGTQTAWQPSHSCTCRHAVATLTGRSKIR